MLSRLLQHVRILVSSHQTVHQTLFFPLNLNAMLNNATLKSVQFNYLARVEWIKINLFDYSSITKTCVWLLHTCYTDFNASTIKEDSNRIFFTQYQDII